MSDQLEIDFGVAVSSEYDADGHLGVGIDLPGGPDDGGKGGAPPAGIVAPFGFLSRPLDPKRDAAGQIIAGCGLMWFRNGDELHVMLKDDPRVVPKLPKVKKGGSMQYCSAGSFAMFDGEDPKGVMTPGSYTLAVSYQSGTTKKTHGLSLDVRTNGAEQLSLRHGEGHGLILTSQLGKKSATLRNAKGNRYIEVNDEKIVIAGKTTVQGAMTVGEQGAAQPVVSHPQFVAFMTKLIGIVGAITAVTPGAPANALIGELAALGTKQLKAT